MHSDIIQYMYSVVQSKINLSVTGTSFHGVVITFGDQPVIIISFIKERKGL